MVFNYNIGDTKFYNNHHNNNKYDETKIINDRDRLYKDNLYMIEITIQGDRILEMTNEGDRIYKDLGRFIKKEINESGGYSIYFDVGHSIYSNNPNDIIIQIHEYHFQPHMILSDIRPKIYNYHLDEKLQKYIKLFWRKKYLLRICVQNKCCSDMIQQIWLYLC